MCQSLKHVQIIHGVEMKTANKLGAITLNFSNAIDGLR